jgi:hypothetical protein
MRRTEVSIDQRPDNRWDVSVGLWSINRLMGGSRDFEIASREDLDATGVAAYLRELIRAGHIRRDTHAVVSDKRGTSMGPGPRVADILAGRYPVAVTWK